jgi:hypothetical protein
VIGRRLAQTRHQPTPDDGYYRPTDQYRRRSQSPERVGDGDVRLASLESANRRLQDELRGVVEDNDRLRDEVERWRKWEREQREPRREEVSSRSSDTKPDGKTDVAVCSRRSNTSTTRLWSNGTTFLHLVLPAANISTTFACRWVFAASSSSTSRTRPLLHAKLSPIIPRSSVATSANALKWTHADVTPQQAASAPARVYGARSYRQSTSSTVLAESQRLACSMVLYTNLCIHIV